MIFFNEQTKTFYLDSKNLTYAFCIMKNGFLEHLYFGKKIPHEEINYAQEYIVRGHAVYLTKLSPTECFDEVSNELAVFGRGDFKESMVAFNNNGVRVGDFKYESYKIYNQSPKLEGMPCLRNGQTLAVTVVDSFNKIKIILYYTVFEDVSAISRRCEIINENENELQIDRAYSFSFDLPSQKWQTISLYGSHLRERYVDRNNLVHGTFCIDSKRGCSSAQLNPFLALATSNADEENGEVYGFNLIYSGDFVFKAQLDQSQMVRLVGGINDYDFCWTLEKNEKFSTPEVVMVYSSCGIGEMSRSFHDLYRDHLMNSKFVKQERPIILNNWEATYFDFNEEKICELIKSASGTGIDMFVLDDGWFGIRNGETSGLGDWFINKEKLPNGFKKIIDTAHKNGMKFGLWFEPEMVNPNSNLYKEHKEWIIEANELTACQGRYQYVLDLSRQEVCNYIIDTMSAILQENEIDYIKWDMNRSISDNYSRYLGKNSKQLHHKYVLGLYSILETITTRFPNIIIEGCASGGCRFDAGMLYYCPQIWTSDNSDAYARALIQYGTSICYPLSAMSCHVSICPNHQTGRLTSFKSRTDIAHLGATGYELNPMALTNEERAQIKQDTNDYKQMQDLVLYGDLYRLYNPFTDDLFAEQLVSKDKTKSLITILKPLYKANGECIKIYPKGLVKNKKYVIKEIDGIARSGETFMNVGFFMDRKLGDFITDVYHITMVED